MEKKEAVKITVEIFGDTYTLKSDNDLNYVKRVAELVNDRMKKIAKRTKSLDSRRVSVLAALEIADEYYRLKKDHDEFMALLEDS